MSIKIRSFANSGVIEQERMSLKVLANTDVGAYAVVFTDRVDNGPTPGNKIAYWFPDAKVEAGDLIILYTKEGKRRTKKLITGRTAHFFYWGLDKAIWDGENIACVLLSVDKWEWKIPPSVDSFPDK